MDKLTSIIHDHRRYLLTGVSYTVPFISAGGLLIAISLAICAFAGYGAQLTNILEVQNKAAITQIVDGITTQCGTNELRLYHALKLIFDIGSLAFRLFPAVLAGFIAYGMVNRPGLVPGMIGGMIASETGAGFLGAIVAGLLAGYCIMLLKKIPFPKVIRPALPILIIPVLGAAFVGVLMLVVFSNPIAELQILLQHWLTGMSSGNKIILGAILGAMIAFDMGGPVNKAAFFFGAAMIEQGNIHIMGAVAAAISVPPLGMGLATYLQRSLWSKEERESGFAAISMGMVGITEGAIPFAASDPFRVIPCIMGGSMVASIMALFAGVGSPAPHGGPIVLPVVEEGFIFILAIIMGSLLSAVSINAWKMYQFKRESQKENSK
ncbi:MAG: PTS fructose transporter subunit IIC [Planctomycetes bacterium]|nr:PTS fructose transporter subunit IIC [Planctomycetota bacterium]